MYLNHDTFECVEKCPEGTFGVVTGNVDDVTTDQYRSCEPCKLVSVDDISSIQRFSSYPTDL